MVKSLGEELHDACVVLDPQYKERVRLRAESERLRDDFYRLNMLERLAATKYAIAATNYEKLHVWIEHRDKRVMVQVMDGWLPTIGTVKVLDENGQVEQKPVCVSVQWYIIDGQPTLFYEATSMVVDHDMVEKWIKEVCPNLKARPVDAMNAHNAMV